MVDARTLARGATTNIASRILGLVFSLLAIKLSTHYLGDTKYGWLTTASLFITTLGAWTELGLGQVVVRRISGRGHDLVRTVGLAMSVSTLVVVPLLIVSPLAGWAIYRSMPTVPEGIAILTAGLLGQAIFNVFTPVAQVTSKFTYYAAADLLGRIAALIVVALTVHFDWGIHAIYGSQLAVPLIQAAAMSAMARSVARFRPIWDWPAIRDLVRETIPLTYIGLVAVLYFTLDGLLLSKLAPAREVGAYGLAYKTIGNLTVISGSVGAVLAARFAADAAISLERMSGTLRSALRIMVFVTIPIAAFIWPIAPDVVRLVSTEDWVPIASAPMALIAVAISIGMLLSVISVALTAAHQQGFLTRLNTINLCINVVANLILIPHLQASGAAIALIISEVSGLLACAVILRRRVGSFLPIWPAARLLPGAAAAVGAAMWASDLHWLLRAGIMVVVYVGAAFALRAVRPSDLEPLRRGGGVAA